MRLVWLILVLSIPAVSASAQGTRDTSNFGAMSQPKTSTANEQSRPTTIQTVPNNMLPAGAGVQRVYRDGKLQAIVR